MRTASYSVFVVFVIIICFCGGAFAAICDAPPGCNCWYVATNGSNLNNGSFEYPFETVQYAINNMSGGDYIYLRNGTYQEGAIDIPISKSGTCSDVNCTSGSWSKIMSYPGEWAVLDGQSSCEVTGASVIGHFAPSHSESSDLKYWWFERLEIMGGGRASRQDAGGFGGNGGPFKFRYIYFHDNHADTGINNPGGLKVYHMHDSVVEFCCFENNGCSGTDTNCAHILIFSDYNWADWAANGYDPNDPFRRPGARNVYRYNHMTNSVVGFKYKGGQLFSGRAAGLNDTYSDYGDKFHHNIVTETRRYGVGAHQDFFQMYNNIMDDPYSGAKVQYEPTFPYYKVAIYNNNIIDSTTAAIMRYADTSTSITVTYEYHGWDLNNIIDNCQEYADMWASSSIDTACHSIANPDWGLTGYTGSHNYIYRPTDTDNYRLNYDEYSQSEYEAQTYTASPRVLYRNAYDAGNLLYTGTTGADKYITVGAHDIETGITVSNGGVGGLHPYLSGVTIPSYVGAVNPIDNDWVAGVLNLTNASVLMEGGSGDPSWVEGYGESASSPTNLSSTNGETWVNHTWDAGSGNMTDSYNASVNDTWYNTSSNEYYNHTGLSAGTWSNITVYAFNNTDGISTGSVSQDVQTSESSGISLSANKFSACNAWNSAQSFAQIDNDVNNLIGMSWYNHTSGWWESYMSGRSYNSNNDIPENCSVFMFVNAVTSVSTPSTVNEITIVSGDWFYGWLPGEVDKTLSEIETEMNTDGLDVWHISAYNGTSRSYTSAGDYSISPRGGFRVHCNVTGAFTI